MISFIRQLFNTTEGNTIFQYFQQLAYLRQQKTAHSL
jgi:hypothetical protein